MAVCMPRRAISPLKSSSDSIPVHGQAPTTSSVPSRKRRSSARVASTGTCGPDSPLAMSRQRAWTGMPLQVTADERALHFHSDQYFVEVGRLRCRLPDWLTPGALLVSHVDMATDSSSSCWRSSTPSVTSLGVPGLGERGCRSAPGIVPDRTAFACIRSVHRRRHRVSRRSRVQASRARYQGVWRWLRDSAVR